MKKLIGLAGVAVMMMGCDHLGPMTSGEHSSGQEIVGSGKSAKATRTVGKFKAIEIDGSIDARVTVGKQTPINIEGDDNIVPILKTEIKGDTLRIYVDGSYTSKLPLKVSLGAESLGAASLNGSGELSLSHLNGNLLVVGLNGSGKVVGDGKISTLDASINGSGELIFTKVKTADATVAVRGSGDAKLSVEKSLSASIAGSGRIGYLGHPKVTQSIAGSGEVAPL